MNFLNEIIPNVTREEEFILCYARPAVSGAARARIARLTAGPLKWGRIDEIAEAHRLRPTLSRHLKGDVIQSSIPAEVWKAIESHAIWATARNHSQTKELARIVKLLRAENIAAMPFKGPILAAHLYGDVALREFLDLDLLVKRDDLLRAKLLLVHQGFKTVLPPNSASATEHFDEQIGFEFVSADGNVQVELHSMLDGTRIDMNGVWKRAIWTDLPGLPVRTVAREDLFPYLCVHAAARRWEKLCWLVDVAEFVRIENGIDWMALLTRSREAGNWRVVALGLYLAYGLLDASLPRDVIKEVSTPEIFELASAVGTWLFNEENRVRSGAMEETRFVLKSKERVTDRLAYTSHFLKERFTRRKRE